MDEEQRVPLSALTAGLEVFPLPEGFLCTDAFVLFKGMDADGDATWSMRRTEHLSPEELLGAMIVQVDRMRRLIAADWDAGDDD